MDSVNDVRQSGQRICHGLVRKLIRTAGTGEVVPADAEVQLALTMYVATQRKTEINDNEQFTWRYEHATVAPLVKSVSHIMPIGLQLAVMTMCAGERAHIWIDSLMAYGSVGLVYGDDASSNTIPPGAALYYEVCLVSWQPSSVATRLRYVVSGTDRFRCQGMTEIEDQLEQANKQLTNGKRDVGLRLLGRAVKMLDRMRLDPEKDPKLAQKRTRLLFNVLSLATECALEIGWYPMAAAYAKRMLEIIPYDPTANFLLGRAYFALGHIDSAKRFVRTAWCNDPANKLYKQKLKEIRDHEHLINGTTDSDDADDTHLAEQLAEVIIEKRERPNVKRQILKDVGRAIEKELKENPNAGAFDIRGGFSQSLVNVIMELFLERNRGYLVRLMDHTSLEIEPLLN